MRLIRMLRNAGGRIVGSFDLRRLRKPHGAALRMFIHIPKTAGTSLRNSVRDRFGDHAMVRDYGPEQAATTPGLRKSYYQSGDPLDMLRVARQLNAVLVCGHMPLSRYGNLVGLPMTCSILREPVARVISNYRHASRLQGYEGGLLSFASQAPHRNMQARILGHLDPALLGVIGLTERYRESIDLLNLRWGWRLSHRVDNVDQDNDRLALVPTEQELAELRQLNLQDIKLYQRAGQVFENSLRYMELGIAHELRGSFTTADTVKGISGWCFAMVADSAPVVELTLNGTPVRTLRPLDQRPLLAGWGLPRHGYIGFGVHNLDTQAGDILSLLDPATGLVLAEVTVVSPA